MTYKAYRELNRSERSVWDRFDAVFRFRPSMQRFPGITEPSPSVTWGLDRLDDDPDYVLLDRMSDTVHAALTELTGAGSLLCLDWQHPSYRVWPSLIGPDNLDPPGTAGWPLSPYPDGDYFIYLAEDFRYGTFGHPWEASLCIFGIQLLSLIETDLHNILGSPIRRDGKPVRA